MSDSVVFVDEFDGEYRLRGVERYCLLDAIGYIRSMSCYLRLW